MAFFKAASVATDPDLADCLHWLLSGQPYDKPDTNLLLRFQPLSNYEYQTVEPEQPYPDYHVQAFLQFSRFELHADVAESWVTVYALLQVAVTIERCHGWDNAQMQVTSQRLAHFTA